MKTLLIIDEKFILNKTNYTPEEELHIIYYSDDNVSRLKIEEDLNSHNFNFSFHYPSEELSTIAKEKRQYFVDFISSIPNTVTNNNKWNHLENCSFGNTLYYTDMFEKNPLSFKSFSLYCALVYIDNLNKKLGPSRAYCHISDYFLQESLKENGFIIKMAPQNRPTKFKFLLRFLKHSKYYLHKKILIKKNLKKRNTKKFKKKLFFVYYPFYSFDDDSKYFRNRYINQFQEGIEEEYTILGHTLPSSNIPISKFYNDLKKSKNKNSHYSIEEFLGICEYLKLFTITFIQYLKLNLRLKKIKNIKIDNIDLTSSIKHQMLVSYSSGKVLDAISLQYLFKKIKHVDEIVYLSENYSWERSLCFQANFFFPHCETKAYKHFAFGPNYTNIFPHKNLEENYLPQSILSIGPHFKKILIDQGWNKDDIISFKSFRYQYLRNINSEKTKPEKNLLILFSIDIVENKFILSLFNGLKLDFNIYYRTHPGRPAKSFMKPPEGWENVNSLPMNEVLQKSNTVISTQGGVVLEAFLSKNKIITPISNININLSPITQDDFDCIFELNGQNFAENIHEIIKKDCHQFPEFKHFFH